MGMFDTIYCSYDLGPGFYNKALQTKGLECLMVEYWLDPLGRLFEIDYTGTQDYVDVPEKERTALWNIFEIVPNGNRGKIKPINVTATIEVYPSVWTAHYAAYPRQNITFIGGQICTKT